MARKNSVQKQVYWQELIDRQAQSGLSIRQFCAEEGVSEAGAAGGTSACGRLMAS